MAEVLIASTRSVGGHVIKDGGRHCDSGDSG